MNSNSNCVFQLKLNVEYVRKPVWRRFQVPSTYTFWDLHCTIQSLMGFEFVYTFTFHAHDSEGRLHAFAMHERPNDYAAEPRLGWLFKIADYLPAKGTTMLYLYELWFPWIFTIELEEILMRDTSSNYPACCGGEGILLEHCGGALAFNEILEIVNDPEHPEYESVKQEIGDGFDPWSFDSSAIRFDDPNDWRIWTMDLSDLAQDLIEESFPQMHSDIDSHGRFPVPFPGGYLNVLVEERLLPEMQSLQSDAELKAVKKVRLSKREIAALTEAVEFRRFERTDPARVRRLEEISFYLTHVADELADEIPPARRGELIQEVIDSASREHLELLEPLPNCNVSLAAAVWRQKGHCLPAIVCRRKDSGQYRFLAAKVPYQPQCFADAAEMAKLDLAHASTNHELPQTEAACRLLMPRISYGIIKPPGFKNVTVVDD